MKKLLETLAIVILSTRVLAQSNEPVRLALIAETDEAATASDVLTAQLSGNQKIQLLERNEIEKVYREQGLSAANKDYLKLGRILGADGLLLFDVVRTPQTTNLMTRLITVKPGVVLTDGSFPWPLKDTTSWAESVATYLNSFLPKLALLPRDAIPISVVNFRSAVQSADGQEAERQVKLLAIQRLSQERQFFVLERQRMQLLSEETELKVDDSAFWNGSYLLEGVVDQNGYSKDVITINARLTPPKGGAPLLVEVSGSRTNLSEVINHLAEKVTELLKVNSAIKEWNATAEAQQYYDEAKWALRWGVFSEAEAAADSAWALGKTDLACAIVRVQSYVSEVLANVAGYEFSEATYSPGGYDANGVPTGPPPSETQIQSHITKMLAKHPWGMAYKEIQDEAQKAKRVQYIFANGPPNPKNIDRALHALELYYEFSRTSPEGEPKILWRGAGWNDWHNSDWYNSGIEDLVAASCTLQNFNLAPLELQKPVSEKLAELRALARSVAEFISKSPSVHDSYFVSDRTAVYDELANTIGEDNPKNSNIFSCEVKWGCFWQEKPEECVALYRELMSSPVFCYIHNKFWFRELPSPRLVAWNEENQKNIPTVWNNFLRELNASTNALLQLEAKALQLADANGESEMAVSFTNFFDAIFINRDRLVANNVDVLYLNWGAGDLVERMGGNSASDLKDSLRHRYYSEYSPRIENMHNEFRQHADIAEISQRQNADAAEAFQRQKQYLKENKPYDFIEIAKLFSSQDYSKAQALEIQPLLAAYKSNLVAQSQNASGMQKGQLMGAIAYVGFLEDGVKRVLNPPVPKPKIAAAQSTSVSPVPVARPKSVPQIPEEPPEMVTNVLLVQNFLKIPQPHFVATNISGLRISANHWSEGKLLLDLQFSGDFFEGDYQEVGGVSLAAAAIFDPTSGRWDMLEYPEPHTNAITIGFKKRSIELFNGGFYLSVGGQLRKYDFATKQWENLDVPGLNNSRLAAVNGRLYAANSESIFEITGPSNGTRILASTRRRPAASALDSLDTLGSPSPTAGGYPLPPQLFSGPEHSLYASVGNKIFGWDGNDWHEVFTLNVSQAPEFFEDAVIFRSVPSFGSDNPANLWIWDKKQTKPQLVLRDDAKPHPGIVNFHPPGFLNQARQLGESSPPPLWKSLNSDYLASSAATFFKSNLYFFVDHAVVTNVSGHWTAAERNGYHAKLICLSRDVAEPVVVPLKFDLERGQPPLKSLGEKMEQIPWETGPTWMMFVGDTLYLGQPDALGVWAIPRSQIDSTIAAQKRIQLDRKAQTAAVAEQARKSFLAKYDLNHNGIIDPDEREAALDDPAFIESELDVIDANHNGWLDAAELAWFDANQNKILEPKEQAGIEIAQHLLAERLLKKFDANGDGFLDRTEFNNLLQSSMETGTEPRPGFSPPFPDDNHDGHVDLAELETFLKQQTRRGLRSRGMPGTVSFNQMRMDASQPVDPRQMFKAAVESYWQNPGSITNRPPFTRRVPPDGGAVTHETQSGTTP
jgi:Ca2+-binding EF-hand superfamily protein